MLREISGSGSHRAGAVGGVLGWARGAVVLAASVLYLLAALAAAGPPRLGAADLEVLISEVSYHPPPLGGDESRLEFIELQNPGDESVDLSGWTLAEGIDFTFPEAAAIEPRGFCVVARDRASFELVYAVPCVLGDFVGRLSNGGERVSLRNRAGALIDRIDYRDGAPWPENPDGLGPTLEKVNPLFNGEDQASWRSSILLGGTPGALNSTDVERTSTVIIAEGDTWKYRKGTSEPANPVGAWAAFAFSDTSWSSGPSGFGYGDGDDATLLSDMQGSYTTVYLRKRFTVASKAALESLRLSIIYDDAYIAYLNGTEIGRSASAGGTPGTPRAYNVTAAQSHGTADGTDSIDLVSFPAVLRDGDNVLGIQVLNQSSSSGDLSMIPVLTAVEVRGAGLLEPAHDLEINEVYPGTDPSNGFLEIHNEGASSQSLAGYRLLRSPDGAGAYVFGAGVTVPARGFVTVSAASLGYSPGSGEEWYGLTTPDLRFVDGVVTRARPPAASWGRYPDGDGDTFVLAGPTLAAPNTVSLEGSVVIHEVQYHPPTAQATAEYIELYNRGASPIPLAGWRLDKGVNYTFPAVTINPGAYVVVSGNPAAVQARYGIAGVLGPWTGVLSNAEDKLQLEDAVRNVVDVVHYADDGTWPASTVYSGPDGFGPSIELVNPGMESNQGTAWAASTGIGTPGAANSRFAADPAPIIRSVEHTPSIPRSGQTVLVTARVKDETSLSSVRLFQSGAPPSAPFPAPGVDPTTDDPYECGSVPGP